MSQQMKYKDENFEMPFMNYDEAGKSFNLEFTEDNFNFYSLKIFPQFEILKLTFPNSETLCCSFSALKNGECIGSFASYERKGLDSWLLRIVLDLKTNYETQGRS